MKDFFKLLFFKVFGVTWQQFVSMRKSQQSTGVVQTGLDETYLFDFRNFASDYLRTNATFSSDAEMATGGGVAMGSSTNGGNLPPPSGTRLISTDTDNTGEKKIPIGKVKLKPIEVLVELETVPNPFSLALLEEKIHILKDKEKLITQHYAKREITALIERLENRKKYNKHKVFFEQFQNTTDEKIGKLLSDHKHLVMKGADIFIPEFPDEAIATMTQYAERLKDICKKKPVFYVIAEEKDFKKSFDRRDPILLVQSPFGFYWQILGAWDKEMLLLSEL